MNTERFIWNDSDVEWDEPRILARKSENEVHAAADEHLDALHATLMKIINAARDAVNRSVLHQAITNQDRHAAEKAVEPAAGMLETRLRKMLPGALLPILVAGGDAGLKIIQDRKLKAAEDAGHEFHGNQYTDREHKELYERGFTHGQTGYSFQKYVAGRKGSSKHGAYRKGYDAGVDASGDLRSALVKSPIVMSFDGRNKDAQAWAEEHAAELAKDIADTTRQEIAAALVDGFEGGDLTDLEDRIIAAVGDEDRGTLIARTEVMTAANEGQRQSWGQAVDEGLLNGNERREWIATEVGACPECEDLDGETTSLDGQYPDPGGDGPPLHPNCRCTEGIVG